MRKVEVQSPHSNYASTEIRADRPMLIKPVMLKEYFDKDGTRMYLGINGKKYYADMLDKMFNPQVKLKVLGERHKGKNADPTNHWMNE